MLGSPYSGGPWQEKLKLAIIGKLTDKLSVSYDLEQQPDMPDRFNVKVDYDKTELTFGDFGASFTDNEFASTSKYLNGVMITSYDNWYNLTLVPTAKLKSETQQLVTQKGANSKGPYNLGHGSIIEGSERVQLNNVLLTRGYDYTINYFSGNITFAKILSTDDQFSYSYEYTNLLDLFFPTVSKRDFIGISTNVVINPELLGQRVTKMEKARKSSLEYFPNVLTPPPAPRSASAEGSAIPPRVVIAPAVDVNPGYVVSVNDVPAIFLHDITGETPARLKAQSVKKRLDAVLASGASTNEVRVDVINGENVVTVKGNPIVTATRSEAAMLNLSAFTLADLWASALSKGLSATAEAPAKISTYEAGSAQQYEWESTGVYKLKYSPVIVNSERVMFKGAQLKRIEDYLINYDDGTITFLQPQLPTALEPLSIEYDYIVVAAESETLPGTGKGPYSLAHNEIIDGSETIYVNNVPYLRELDYKIDYKQGSIIFYTDIPQTANVVAKYKYLAVTTPPAPPTPVVPRSLKLGVTYLKESGQRGNAAPSSAVTENKSGSDIINNNNTLYLSYRPVTMTSEVDVERNDTVLAYGVDYVFPTVEASTGNVIPAAKLAYMTDPSDLSDGLKTGTIKFLTALSPTDEVSVSYSYSNWSTERYSGSGNSGTLTYYIGNYRNLVPGTEVVQIWRKNDPNPSIKTLVRNSSIEVFDGNYSINYSDPANFTFNSDPIVVNGETFYLNDINFTVLFKFVAQVSVTDRPLVHDVIAVQSAFNVGDNLKLEGSFARSNTDQVFTSISTNETFNGDGKTRLFNLHAAGQLVDGGEQVFLNGQKLNRDDQYYFSYDSNTAGKFGILTFFSIIPSTLDVISIDYKYQSSSGTVTNISEKQGNAFKVSAALKPNNLLEFAGDYKKIDSDFSPMGGTSIPLGSEYKHAYTKITPLTNFWMSGDIKETTNPIANFNNRFLSSYDRNYASGFNPYGIAQISMGYRDFSTLDELLPGATLHTNDYKSDTYTLSVVPAALRYGEYGYQAALDAKKTAAFTDTKDKHLPQDILTDYYHMNNTFDLTKRVKWVLDYQVNLPTTISYESGTRSKGKVVQRQEVDDLNSFLNWDLTFAGIRKLYAFWNKIGHNENNFISGTTRSTINETYHTDFIPIDQITTSIDQTRQEIPTVSTAYGNPRSERQTATVRFTPYSSTAFNWSGSRDETLAENGAKTSGNANMYSVDHTPIATSLYKLTTKFTLSSSIRNAPLGTEPVVSTDTRDFIQDYNFSYNALQNLTLLSGFQQEDYTNKNDSFKSPVNTVSQSQTTTVGSVYKIFEDMDLSGNYSVKVTQVPNQSAHKSIVDAHAVYRFLLNGTLNYDWNQEDNGGEILGGSFVDQDFLKIIQSLSVNYVVTQGEQLILSSIVLRAGVKWADFHDRNNPSNSFQATLLTFEGTFNF